MKKLLLVPILFLAGTTASFAQISPGLQARLDFVLDSVCTVHNIKGASAAVLMPGQGTWTGTYGESHTGTPVTEDMHFGIGSNTKTFTAVLMLKLQENGLLDLDDTIGTWITSGPTINGQVTIRQLLNHTSGLYNFTNSSAFNAAINSDPSALWQPEDVLQFVYNPVFAPGTDWEYSNTNYLLAGMIISDVLGVPFYQALRDSILIPKGLTNTISFPYELSGVTVPHYWSIYLGMPYMIDGEDVNYSQNAMATMANAAGAVFSTAEDNVKFWNKLLSGDIINNASLQEMQDCIYLSPATRYGLGIFRRSNFNGHVAYNHGGTNLGFINENIADSITGTCISVLTNQDSIGNNIILTKLIAALHKETLGPLAVNPTNTTGLEVAIYPNPAGKFVNITSTKDGLTMYLSDISGRDIMTRQLNNGTMEVTLENIASGIYMIRVTNKDKQTVFTNKLSVH